MSRLPDKYDAIQDITIATKLTNGGDTGPVIAGSTDDTLALYANNTQVALMNDLSFAVALDESITLNATNAGFPSFIELQHAGNTVLRSRGIAVGEATCELTYPNYDSWITNDSVLRKQYIDNTYLKFTSLKPNGGVILDTNQLAVDLSATGITGTLGTADGGTNLTAFTPNSFLIAPTSTTLNTSKAVPAGIVVGHTDTIILSNKTLVDASTVVSNLADDTKKFNYDCSTIPTLTQRVVQANPSSGQLVVSTLGESVNFNSNGALNQRFALNGGLGNVVGDQLTYVGGSLYPFFTNQEWTNLTLVVGAISYEDFATPISFNPGAAYTLIPFPGILQSGAFQITTNSLGRLTNIDGITWAFLINFSCSLTGGNGTEWEIALHINGVKVSNPYVTTVASSGRYVSLTGVWVQNLFGSSNGGVGPANQYAEIFIKRNVGSGNVTIASAFLAVQAIRMQSRPP